MRPRRDIPFEDVKGLKTLLEEMKLQGKKQKEIEKELAEYYGLSERTIRRRLKELKECK